MAQWHREGRPPILPRLSVEPVEPRPSPWQQTPPPQPSHPQRRYFCRVLSLWYTRFEKKTEEEVPNLKSWTLFSVLLLAAITSTLGKLLKMALTLRSELRKKLMHLGSELRFSPENYKGLKLWPQTGIFTHRRLETLCCGSIKIVAIRTNSSRSAMRHWRWAKF